jgi:urea transport system permease protein
MRVVSARLVALLFAFAIVLAAPAADAPAQPASESAAPAPTAPTAPAEATVTPEAQKTVREGFPGTLDKFLENDFDATDTAVSEVAAGGNPRAATIIEALRDERLYFSAETKTVYYKDAGGKLFSAETGEAVADEPDDLAAVDINNRVRRGIDAALGSMTLMAPDPNRRFQAAQAVFKSREASTLPALDAALEKETDPRVKLALTEARAAVILNSEDASEADKIEAVGVVRGRGDQEALSLL